MHERAAVGAIADSSSLNRYTRQCGIGLLVITKGADAVTTAVGLLFFAPLVEQNPVLRWLIGGVGHVPAILLGSVFVVGVVVSVTELGAVVCRHTAGEQTWPRLAVRFVGYVPLSLLFGVAAVHNAYLIGRVAGPVV